jgi:hypothetical protein
MYLFNKHREERRLKEGFVSGTEKLIARYDNIYPLDHPKYVTPQQKDFQIVLSEHSALDPNLQNRRQEVRTQMCRLGDHCFNTQEYHALNYKTKSSPDILSSKINPEKPSLPDTIYERHNSEFVVPSNSTAREARADLFDDIIIPDLFFKQKSIQSKDQGL